MAYNLGNVHQRIRADIGGQQRTGADMGSGRRIYLTGVKIFHVSGYLKTFSAMPETRIC